MPSFDLQRCRTQLSRARVYGWGADSGVEGLCSRSSFAQQSLPRRTPHRRGSQTSALWFFPPHPWLLVVSLLFATSQHLRGSCYWPLEDLQTGFCLAPFSRASWHSFSTLRCLAGVSVLWVIPGFLPPVGQDCKLYVWPLAVFWDWICCIETI